MIFLTRKEKIWTVAFILPFYFIFARFVLSFLFLSVSNLLKLQMNVADMDIWFNMFYDGVGALLTVWIYRGFLKKTWQHDSGKRMQIILWSCTAGLLILFLASMAGSLFVNLLAPDSASANQSAIESMVGQQRLAMIVTTSLFAPVYEEMVFRVGIFTSLYEYHPELARWVSSLTFGAVHILTGLMSGDLTQILYLVPYGLLGYVLCIIYEKKQSIFAPVIVHALNNLISVLLL